MKREALLQAICKADREVVAKALDALQDKHETQIDTLQAQKGELERKLSAALEDLERKNRTGTFRE